MPRTPFSKLPVQPNMEGWCLEKMGIGKSRDRLQATYELTLPNKSFEFLFHEKTVHDIAKGQIELYTVNPFSFFIYIYIHLFESTFMVDFPASYVRLLEGKFGRLQEKE